MQKLRYHKTSAQYNNQKFKPSHIDIKTNENIKTAIYFSEANGPETAPVPKKDEEGDYVDVIPVHIAVDGNGYENLKKQLKEVAYDSGYLRPISNLGDYAVAEEVIYSEINPEADYQYKKSKYGKMKLALTINC